VGRRRALFFEMIHGSRSRNGSKDAVGSGRTGWTAWDTVDGLPWIGETPKDPMGGVGRVPFVS
jgi:hypothetical protein